MKDIQEDIQQYIHGQLPDGDRHRIAQLLKENKAYQEEYNWQQTLFSANRNIEHMRFKSLLQQIELQNKKSRTKVWMKWISILFILGLLALLLSRQYNRISAPNKEGLYASYYDPYPNKIAPIVRSTEVSQLQSAFIAYDNGEYLKALQELQNIAADIDQLNFYKAICLMSLERYDEAIDYFEYFTYSSEPWQGEALWYQALCFLKKEDYTKVNLLLNQILTSSDNKAVISRAKQLQEDIKALLILKK